jgi:hypothetical protein
MDKVKKPKKKKLRSLAFIDFAEIQEAAAAKGVKIGMLLLKKKRGTPLTKKEEGMLKKYKQDIKRG